MALEPRKRQKKAERRNAKQRAKRKKLIASRARTEMAGPLVRAVVAPIVHCCASASLWEEGIGEVLLSRAMSNHQVGFAAFLVDVYCLGVKDAAFDVIPRSQYDSDVYGRMREQDELIALKPECARKLIEGAVEFARDSGFPPHRDFRKARAIFGDVDAGQCEEVFEYGHDGKPYFIRGPYDSPARCARIVQALTQRFGPEGFRFLMLVDESQSGLGWTEDDDEEEIDDTVRFIDEPDHRLW